MTPFWLVYLCKDPVSKPGHMLRFRGLGLNGGMAWWVGFCIMQPLPPGNSDGHGLESSSVALGPRLSVFTSHYLDCVRLDPMKLHFCGSDTVECWQYDSTWPISKLYHPDQTSQDCRPQCAWHWGMDNIQEISNCPLTWRVYSLLRIYTCNSVS